MNTILKVEIERFSNILRKINTFTTKENRFHKHKYLYEKRWNLLFKTKSHISGPPKKYKTINVKIYLFPSYLWTAQIVQHDFVWLRLCKTKNYIYYIVYISILYQRVLMQIDLIEVDFTKLDEQTEFYVITQLRI